MANHRLQVTDRTRRTVTPRNLRALPPVAVYGLLFQAVVVTGGMSLMLYAWTGPVAGSMWLALSLVDLFLQAAFHVRQNTDRSQLRLQEGHMLDRLASNPGGAPLVADFTGHCGCVHRYAYDEVQAVWLQVAVVEPSDHCPITAW